MLRRPLPALARLGLAALAATLPVLVVPTPASAAGTPAFDVFAVGQNSGEPSIGYDLGVDAALYQSNTTTVRLAWDDSTTPATVTRTTVNAPTAVTSLDPILFTDQQFGTTTDGAPVSRTYTSQLTLACSLLSFTDDGGDSYTPSSGCGLGTVLDHQTVGGGAFHALAGVTPPGRSVYYCAQNGFSGTCAVSLDGGLTFQQAVPAYNTPANAVDDPDPTVAAEGGACSAIHGHLRVGADGTAYLPIKGCGGVPTAGNLTNTEFAGGNPSVVTSTDNGTSWQVHRVLAGHNSDESDPSVATGRGDAVDGGRVYFGWEDEQLANPETDYGTNSTARIATSDDGGVTFSDPVDVSTPLGIKNIMFPEVIAGDDDRAAFSFIGTPAAGDDQHNPSAKHPDAIDPTAPWHLYVSMTYDGGATWTTTDVTPTDDVQHGCISLQGTSNKNLTDPPCRQRNLLDFNDITVDGAGRVLVAYADGCTEACVTDPSAGSKGAVDMVARQSAGPGLYAAADATGLEPVVPEAPLVALLPLLAVGLLGGAVLLRRRRPSIV